MSGYTLEHADNELTGRAADWSQNHGSLESGDPLSAILISVGGAIVDALNGLSEEVARARKEPVNETLMEGLGAVTEKLEEIRRALPTDTKNDALGDALEAFSGELWAHSNRQFLLKRD
jgi:hypothetical protein